MKTAFNYFYPYIPFEFIAFIFSKFFTISFPLHYSKLSEKQDQIHSEPLHRHSSQEKKQNSA